MDDADRQDNARARPAPGHETLPTQAYSGASAGGWARRPCRRSGRGPSGPHVWALDFQFDQTADGRLLNLLNVVAAYSGMKGDTEKERQLTDARSMVVRDYLAQNFRLDDTRIKTIGLGKTQDAGESGGVEILVYPVGSNAPVAQSQAARR